MVQESESQQPRTLPPGQKLANGFPVRHYGPVPRFRPDTWRLTVNGATSDGAEHHLDIQEFAALRRDQVVGDLHCVTKWTVLDNVWEGVLARTLMEAVPPADDVTHVMVWAEFGYSANLRMDDFLSARTILATHHNGTALTPEHGWPLRLVVPHLYGWKGPKWLRMIEYLTAERRGYWEERGYHTEGNPWREQRYSYQE
ncbi:MAG TPA: sulfite oxidase-like oxidoreductase [Kineosporiaceae bacterium]|nr:sulfite oxidase-like oxidoreductase [Kineosporiaceae bacterium]